jgi:hypothetical protein
MLLCCLSLSCGNTGRGSPWVVIALTTPGTRARQQLISPPQNSFSTLLFLLPAHHASFYGIDLTNFYLNTPMEHYEYMHCQLEILPQETINKYGLTDIVDGIC